MQHDELAPKRPPASSSPPWQIPIPVCGVTGEHNVGKTLFLLTIAPAQRTLIYDTELSAESYQDFGFHRVDVPLEMQRRHPHGYKPVDTFTWWMEHVRAIEPGQFDVIALDIANDLESGALDWVRSHPEYFSRTAAQYLKMSALLWRDMKELWKLILADLASRCQTFGFAVHMSDVWVGDKPTGKRKPRGKTTLFELASVYLQSERSKNSRGEVPAEPSAILLKSRLAHTRKNSATGAIEIFPALPPRLPVATPAAIRQYLDTPPNYDRLSAQERAPEKEPTNDERAAVKLAIAEAEAEAARLQLERLERQQQAEERRANRAAGAQARTAPVQQQMQATATPVPIDAAQVNGAARPASAQSDPGKATFEQLQQLHSLRAELFGLLGIAGHRDVETKTWADFLSKRNVTTARDLTPGQVGELIGALTRKAERLHAQRRPANETEAAAAERF
jgi:hypothetical protein